MSLHASYAHSTYSSRASDTDTSCAAIGKGCEEWAKDEKVVDCDAIEDAMKRAEKCVSAVERLDLRRRVVG